MSLQVKQKHITNYSTCFEKVSACADMFTVTAEGLVPGEIEGVWMTPMIRGLATIHLQDTCLAGERCGWMGGYNRDEDLDETQGIQLRMW